MSAQPVRAPAFAPPLFERLPTKLFSPLASLNRDAYWNLLCHLHHRRFGPDAPIAPSHGYQSREVIADIEEFLADQNAWAEDGESPDTPLGIRAAGVYKRLLEAGWLREERQGPFAKGVSVRPAVSQFLSMLITFAESGPIYLSGKINTIDAILRAVLQGAAGGESVLEAAQQARNLLEHVRNTGTLVRDLMESLNQDMTPAEYVHRFFQDYIERVFIADYRELRTREHPLSKRQQILRIIEEIESNNEHRIRILSWYEQQKSLGGDREQAIRQYERDLHRLYELQRIDEYLDRLDDEIRRANKRALAYLDYRLRAVRPVDHLVRHAIDAVNKAGQSAAIGDPFPPGEMINALRLAEPRKSIDRAPPSALRRSAPTAEELARAKLMLRAREARSVTMPKLSEFARRHLVGIEHIHSEDLHLSTIEDVRAYQTMLTLAKSNSSPSRRLQLAARAQMRGFHVQLTGEPARPQRFISGAPFALIAPPSGVKEEK